MPATVSRFVAFSSAITAFSSFDLYGTGLASDYFNLVLEIVGDGLLEKLLSTWEGIAAQHLSLEETRRLLRTLVFADEALGPIARNLLKLWYLGTWYELPPEWRDANGISMKDTTRVVSPLAYVEGLLWPAVGANPSGAKAPGYGSWQAPPSFAALSPNIP